MYQLKFNPKQGLFNFVYSDSDRVVPDGIVLVYAEWCGHCKRFMSTYNEISEELQKKGLVAYAINEKILSEQHKETLNVQGYPTIIKISDGQVVSFKQYKGPRTVQDICQWTMSG